MNRLVFLCAVLAFVAAPAVAQRDSLLRAAVQLSTEGRGDSARAVVQRVLATSSPSDSIYPEALYTLGVVAADAEEAMRALRRVVIEFGLSEWADDATLRLIQLAYAGGDPGAALSWQERFERDHPASPLRAEALYWGARAQFDLRNEAAGCTLLHGGVEASPDVELKNRLEFYLQRCTPVDSTAPQPAAGRPYFAVQVIAVKSADAADETLGRLKDAGFEAAVTRDQDGLIKVRVGRYGTRAEAAEVAGRIRQRLGGQPFVVEVTP